MKKIFSFFLILLVFFFFFCSHLFDVEEVFSVKGDGHAWHRDVVIVTRAVADICTHGECNWFDLEVKKKQRVKK